MLPDLGSFLVIQATPPAVSMNLAPGALQRGVVGAIVCILAIFLTWNTSIKGRNVDKDGVGRFVGFFAFISIVVGGFLAAVSTVHWPMILLVAGGCLGAGFVFGMLFGYPLSATTSPNGGTAQHSNIMKQSADALSKVIAGATLVQIKPIAFHFKNIALAISFRALGTEPAPGNEVFGAAVILYFFLLGFLIGLLLLPIYHLNDADDDSAPAPAPQPNPNPPPPGPVAAMQPDPAPAPQSDPAAGPDPSQAPIPASGPDVSPKDAPVSDTAAS
jgi:hypothetical protein